MAHFTQVHYENGKYLDLANGSMPTRAAFIKDDKTGDDLDALLMEHGYESLAELEVKGNGLFTAHHSIQESAPYPYLAIVSFNADYHIITIAHFGDLLAVLRELGSVAAAISQGIG